MAHTTEISFELPAEEVAVLDGYCQAKSLKRTAVIRTLLREWSDAKKHEAIMICRVAGVNPTAPVSDRGQV
jgi:hypothetical protein